MLVPRYSVIYHELVQLVQCSEQVSTQTRDSRRQVIEILCLLDLVCNSNAYIHAHARAHAGTSSFTVHVSHQMFGPLVLSCVAFLLAPSFSMPSHPTRLPAVLSIAPSTFDCVGAEAFC